MEPPASATQDMSTFEKLSRRMAALSPAEDVPAAPQEEVLLQVRGGDEFADHFAQVVQEPDAVAASSPQEDVLQGGRILRRDAERDANFRKVAAARIPNLVLLKREGEEDVEIQVDTDADKNWTENNHLGEAPLPRKVAMWFFENRAAGIMGDDDALQQAWKEVVEGVYDFKSKKGRKEWLSNDLEGLKMYSYTNDEEPKKFEWVIQRKMQMKKDDDPQNNVEDGVNRLNSTKSKELFRKESELLMHILDNVRAARNYVKQDVLDNLDRIQNLESFRGYNDDVYAPMFNNRSWIRQGSRNIVVDEDDSGDEDRDDSGDEDEDVGGQGIDLDEEDDEFPLVADAPLDVQDSTDIFQDNTALENGEARYDRDIEAGDWVRAQQDGLTSFNRFMDDLNQSDVNTFKAQVEQFVQSGDVRNNALLQVCMGLLLLQGILILPIPYMKRVVPELQRDVSRFFELCGAIKVDLPEYLEYHKIVASSPKDYYAKNYFVLQVKGDINQEVLLLEYNVNDKFDDIVRVVVRPENDPYMRFTEQELLRTYLPVLLHSMASDRSLSVMQFSDNIRDDEAKRVLRAMGVELGKKYKKKTIRNMLKINQERKAEASGDGKRYRWFQYNGVIGRESARALVAEEKNDEIQPENTFVALNLNYDSQENTITYDDEFKPYAVCGFVHFPMRGTLPDGTPMNVMEIDALCRSCKNVKRLGSLLVLSAWALKMGDGVQQSYLDVVSIPDLVGDKDYEDRQIGFTAGNPNPVNPYVACMYHRLLRFERQFNFGNLEVEPRTYSNARRKNKLLPEFGEIKALLGRCFDVDRQVDTSYPSDENLYFMSRRFPSEGEMRTLIARVHQLVSEA